MSFKQKGFFCIALIILFSCSDKKNTVPQEILKPDKMRLVLWDVLRADAFTFDYITKDSAKKPETENIKLQQQIFLIHKTTREAFYKSYEYYKTHPSLMQPILDSIISKATIEKYIKKQSATKGADTLKAK